MGFSVYEKDYCNVDISFDTDSSYGSKIDISIDSNNPREKAQGIYNGIMDFVNQNKTYNYIFHNVYLGIFGGIGIGLFPFVIILALREYLLWATLLFFASFMIISYSYYGPKLKPYSEFSTNRQKRYNKIFSFFIWGFISYLIFGLGFGLLKDYIIK